MKIKTLIIIISLFIMSCNNKNVPSVPKHYIEYCNKIGGIHYNVHKKRKEFNESTAKIYCKSDYPDKDIDNEDLNMVSSFSEINMYEYLRSELIHHI